MFGNQRGNQTQNSPTNTAGVPLKPEQDPTVGSSTRDTQQRFENLIALKLIDDYINSRSIRIHSRLSLEQQQLEIQTLANALNKLNGTLFTKATQQKVHQITIALKATELELTIWNTRNHLNDLPKLIPERVFTQLTEQQIAAMIDRILAIPDELKRLSLSLEQQQANKILYPQQVIEDSKQTITIMALQKNHLILRRYQQMLSHSNLDQSVQQQKLEAFGQIFNLLVAPAFTRLATQIETISTTTGIGTNTRTGIAIKTGTGIKDWEKSNSLDLNPLRTKIESALATNKQQTTDLLATGAIAPSNLRLLYQDPKFTLYQQNNAEQRLLNLFSLYSTANRPTVQSWFSQLPANEILLVANDLTSSLPLEYDNNQLLLDLKLLLTLPEFEFEALVYQHILPGRHLINEYSQLVPSYYFYSMSYSYGWSVYALKLAGQKDAFIDALSKLGYLIRYKLTLCHAMVDIKLQTGQWTSAQAKQYLAEQMPYASDRLEQQVAWLVANPGIASAGLDLAFTLFALQNQATNQMRIPLKDFHNLVLQYAPTDVEFLHQKMPAILQQFAKSIDGTSN
ncbi:MAG: DUF885 family protein [Pseudomonadales bacterium]|nr:DUF885 family protein [Pseudomonadales bacterium]